VTPQILSLPGPELVHADLNGHLPAAFAEIMDRVFIEEAGVADTQQAVEVAVAGTRVLGALRFPRLDQVLPGREFAPVGAVPRWVLAANFELAGAFHEGIGHPALEDRIIVGIGLRGQVECIAVRDAVSGEDLAPEGDHWQQAEKHQDSHDSSIRHTN